MVVTTAHPHSMVPVGGISPPLRHAWLVAAATMAVTVLTLGALFWDAVAGAVRVWYVSPTFNHGFLIVPIVIYLLWERRRLFATVAPRPSFWGLPLHLAFGAMWLVADTASIQEAQQLAIMGMLQATFLTVLGWQAYRTFLFPCLYLFFLVPSGEFLVPGLQDFTAVFVVKGLALVGVPVFHDGIFISIPNGNFEVAEACAGLRFLIATIAFAFLFSYLTYRSMARRAFFIVLAIVVPVIANGFRAFGIVMLAHLSDNKIAAGADHIIYGWGFFSVVLLLLIWIGMRFRDDADEDDDADGAAAPVTAPSSPWWHVPLGGLLVLAVVSVAPAYAHVLRSLDDGGDLTALKAPIVGGGWHQVSSTINWRPVFETADGTVQQAYERDGRRVEVFIAYYNRQRRGAEVIAFANRMTGGGAWNRAGGMSAMLPIDGVPQQVAGTRITDGSAKAVVLHWNWIDGSFTAGTLMSKILQARGELLNGRRAAAKVAILATYQDRPAESVALVREFLGDMESLESVLERVATSPAMPASTEDR